MPYEFFRGGRPGTGNGAAASNAQKWERAPKNSAFRKSAYDRMAESVTLLLMPMAKPDSRAETVIISLIIVRT